MHIILVVHGGIFQNPFSERYAFALKVACADQANQTSEEGGVTDYIPRSRGELGTNNYCKAMMYAT